MPFSNVAAVTSVFSEKKNKTRQGYEIRMHKNDEILAERQENTVK